MRPTTLVLCGLLASCAPTPPVATVAAPSPAAAAPAPSPASSPLPAASAPGMPPAPPDTPLPPVREGDFVLRDFHFTDGETLPELRIHYATLGAPLRDAAGRTRNAVLILHGTGGTGRQFLQPKFAALLFGPGQPLDAARYFIILPDDVGHGRSSKPSDGLRARFPQYRYADMVAAEHELLARGLGVDHARLVMGTSMGGMHTWMWAERYPDFMDAAMPLACQPTAIVGRNRVWRAMAIHAIKSDPEWKGGDYAAQPRAALETVGDLLAIAGSAPLSWQARFATREVADRFVDDTVARSLATIDANDILYALSASADYDPSGALEQIQVPLTFVNSADDFINPPELAIAERAIRRVKQGRFVLVAATPETQGHGTHTWPVFWQTELVDLLARSAR
jgi:homoserine O-acetyltransferase